ncbi:helix-turn-helix domain-containing protein [Lentilactobacillus raoultii]|uniref:Helix-turn-helix domain-containing protein n=1 Tax=Lentilactobacillus raoultii TaxID=1987503 RepID=A0ABW3PF62_9LACO|nr:helix-turn-helix transcriptional regulator [Lentilactobacillus raoultii]
MTPTQKIIEQLSEETPNFKEKIQHYQQQNELGIKISELRHEVGLTQQQLADKIHVPQSTIARWESGDGNITMKNLSKIAQSVHKELVIRFV